MILGPSTCGGVCVLCVVVWACGGVWFEKMDKPEELRVEHCYAGRTEVFILHAYAYWLVILHKAYFCSIAASSLPPSQWPCQHQTAAAAAAPATAREPLFATGKASVLTFLDLLKVSNASTLLE